MTAWRHRLFAKYAHAPNALGYCGPAAAAALRAVAVRCRRGRRRPGARPGVLGRLALPAGAGRARRDRATLSTSASSRGYWTGNELTEQVGNAAFGTALLDRIRPQAGALLGPPHRRPVGGGRTDARLPRLRRLPLVAAAGHRAARAVARARLLPHRLGRGGRRWSRTQLLVRMRHLTYDGRVLSLGADRGGAGRPPRRRRVVPRRGRAGGPRRRALGLRVRPCSPTRRSAHLERWTVRQLEVMAPRLAATTAAGRPAAPPAAPAR